ncbi:MAG: RraA family protein [Holosporales bacterium]|jgi:regulator of RNase E activity RraA|nr:RraA family protein [Holosporales bacterium]
MTDKISFLKKTETGVITDALENLKIGSWTRKIHPTNPEMKLSGRAVTVRFEYVNKPSASSFRGMFDVIGRCSAGYVLIIAASDKGAMLGEHVIHAAINKGLSGLVSDGMFRDFLSISRMNFPTFCSGAEALHAPKNFKVVEMNGPITCGGMVVNPGDYIVGDYDGVIAIPADRIDDMIYQAEKIIEAEELLLTSLNDNCDMEKCISLAKEKSTLRT